MADSRWRKLYPAGPPARTYLRTYDRRAEDPACHRALVHRSPVPGIEICEHFEKQAAIMDRLAIVRSVTGMAEEHDDCQVMSG